MKILYIGSERDDAKAVGTALRGISQDVTLLWARSLDHAARWLDDNRDLTALVVDVQMEAASWPASLKQLRSLPLRPAVIVVVPEGTLPKFDSLGPPADGYVTRGQTFLHDLPVAITGAVARVRGSQPQPPTPGELAEPPQTPTTAPDTPRERTAWKNAFQKLRARRGGEQTAASQALDSADSPVPNTSQPDDPLTEVMVAKAALERRLAELEASSQRWSVEHAAASERQAELDALVHLERMARADLEQKLADVTAAFQDAEEQHVAELAAARLAHELAAAEQLTEQQRELQALLTQEVERRRTAEAMLAGGVSTEARDASGSSRSPEPPPGTEHARSLEAHDPQSKDVIERLTQRQVELDEQVRHERALRATLEQAITQANGALCDAQQRHDEALATLASELAERQSQFDRELSQRAWDHGEFEKRLTAATAALDQSKRAHQAATADIERLRQREADLAAKLAGVQATCESLNRQLVEATGTGERAGQREAELVEQIQHERLLRSTLEQTIENAEADMREMRQQHDTAIGRLTQREADLSAQLAETTTSRADLERQLTAAQAAIEEADNRATRERLTASKKAADREAELEEQIQRERVTRAGLEQAVADANAALRDSQQRHEAALARAASEVAERKAYFDRELSQTAADRASLRQRLSAAEIALDRIRRDQQSAAADVDRLTQREAELAAELANVQATRDMLETKLTAAEREIAEASEQAARERASMEERQADLEARLVHEIDGRETLERTLNETRTAALDAERWFHQEVDALRAQRVEQETHLEARLAAERLAYEGRLGEMRTERERLDQVAAAANAEVQRLKSDVERVSSEHATALAALTASVAERDETIRAMERARTELQEQLQTAVTARRADIEHVQEKLIAAVEALEATKRNQTAPHSESDRAPQSRELVGDSRAETDKSLQKLGMELLRHTKDSALV